MPVDLKRALKDKAYLDSLSKDELKEALLTVAGSKALGDADLDKIAGGRPPVGSTRSCEIAC